MQCIFTLLTLFLLIVRITSDCVDILSGCRKACLSNGECSVSTGYLCQEQVCQGLFTESDRPKFRLFIVDIFLKKILI